MGWKNSKGVLIMQKCVSHCEYNCTQITRDDMDFFKGIGSILMCGVMCMWCCALGGNTYVYV